MRDARGGLLSAFLVGSVYGIDDDALARFNEEGNANLGSARDGGWLEGIGGGVAAHAGFGVGYLEGYGRWKLYAQWAVLVRMEHYHARHAVYQKLRSVDDLFGHGDLLKRLHIHKVVAVGVVVQVLVGAKLNIDDLELGSAREGVLQNTSVVEVAQFGSHKCRPFAGFHMQKFDDLAGRVVKVNAHAILNVCCRGHNSSISAKVRNRLAAI